MSTQDLNMLNMVSELSMGSKSIASQGVRDYTATVQKNAKQYTGMLTDLRDVKAPIEQEIGKVFQALA